MTSFKPKVSVSSTEYWSTFKVSGIHDTTSADAKSWNTPSSTNTNDGKNIYLYFTSPAIVSTGYIDVGLSPWQQTINTVIGSNLIGEKMYKTEVNISAADTAINLDSLEVSIGVAGDAGDAKYRNSFILSTEQLNLTGTVEIELGSKPSMLLSNDVRPVLTFTAGSIKEIKTLEYDKTNRFTLTNDRFTVSAESLINDQETVMVPVIYMPQELSVVTGETKDLEVSFGPVTLYGALNVTVSNDLPDVLSIERLQITIEYIKAHGNTGNLPDSISFFSPVNHTTELRKLTRGEAKISTEEIRLNNVRYVFNPSIFTLGDQQVKQTIDKNLIVQHKDDTQGYINQQFNITGDESVHNSVSGNFIF